MRSFEGDPALKASLLAALDARIEASSLAPIELGGRRFEPYDTFAGKDTLALASQALRIPEDLLRLGSYLFQGFPEDARSIAHHVRSARTWLAALPVGQDLADVTREFAIWRLTDAHDGVVRFVHRPDVRAALDAVADALILDDAIEQAQACESAQALARDVGGEIPAQSRAAGRVDDEVYLHLRALETAVAAADVGRLPGAAASVAHVSVFGAFGCNIPPAWLHSDAMQRWLMARLAGSP